MHTYVCICTYTHPGLAGSGDEVDKAAVMGIVEAVEEVWVKLSQYFWEKDETKKVSNKN